MRHCIANGLGDVVHSPTPDQMWTFLREIDVEDEEHGAAWLSLDDDYSLIWGRHATDGNRVLHVLKHTVADPTKPLHSVFSMPRNEVLALIDEAWMRRGLPVPNDPARYLIQFDHPIGTVGEKVLRIVVSLVPLKSLQPFPSYE